MHWGTVDHGCEDAVVLSDPLGNHNLKRLDAEAASEQKLIALGEQNIMFRQMRPTNKINGKGIVGFHQLTFHLQCGHLGKRPGCGQNSTTTK